MSGRVIEAMSMALEARAGTKVCRCCGFDYVHITSVAVKQGDKITAIDGEHAITCPCPGNHRRGSDVAIEYRCESGCCFVELFSFHKGQVFETCVEFGCDPDEPIEELWRD